MKKILVIEDDFFLMGAYKMKLVETGNKILTATNGEEGFEMAKSELPSLIVLDLVLPGKSGVQVLRELKSDESTKEIPVIVASNLDQKEQIDECKSLGIVDYYIKSDISIHDLLDKINAVVG